MRRRLNLLLIAFSSLAGCKETENPCQFLDQGFLYPSPVVAADLLPARLKDDTAMKAARRTVEACYNERPSDRAEGIVPWETRRGLSGRIYMLYLSVGTTDTVVGFGLGADLKPMFAVVGALPTDFWNRTF
jgi:hypothetical protein